MSRTSPYPTSTSRDHVPSLRQPPIASFLPYYLLQPQSTTLITFFFTSEGASAAPPVLFAQFAHLGLSLNKVPWGHMGWHPVDLCLPLPVWPDKWFLGPCRWQVQYRIQAWKDACSLEPQPFLVVAGIGFLKTQYQPRLNQKEIRKSE